MARKQLGTSPSNSTDATTKAYVDTAVASAAANTGFQSVTTAAGTTTLTSSSPFMTQFTGSTTQTCVLPDATTLSVGRRFVLSNRSTGSVQVNMNGGSALQTLFSTSEATLTLTANGTAAGTWDVVYLTTGGSVGTAAAAYVATGESTTSTAYTDLATTSDTVTVTIGASGMALVTISAAFGTNSGAIGLMSYGISGANTASATDAKSLSVNAQASGQGIGNLSGSFLETGLAAGSTTFKAKYKSSNGSYSQTFTYRRISVIPINNTNLWAGLTNNLEGSFSALPAAGTAGRLYTASDTGLTLMDNGSSWDRIYGGPLNRFTPPPSSGWTTVGSPTSVGASLDGRLVVAPSATGGLVGEYVSLSASSNYTVTAYIEATPGLAYVDRWDTGIILSDGTKYLSFGAGFYSTTGTLVYILSYATSGSAAGSVYSKATASLPSGRTPEWIRIRDDGTTRYYELSINGVDWSTFYSEARTTYLTATKAGYGVTNISTGTNVNVRLRSWNVTTP